MDLVLFLILWAASFAICRALCMRFEDYFDDIESVGFVLSIFPIVNIPCTLITIGVLYSYEEGIDEKIGDWFFKRKE